MSAVLVLVICVNNSMVVVVYPRPRNLLPRVLINTENYYTYIRMYVAGFVKTVLNSTFTNN